MRCQIFHFDMKAEQVKGETPIFQPTASLDLELNMDAKQQNMEKYVFFSTIDN